MRFILIVLAGLVVAGAVGAAFYFHDAKLVLVAALVFLAGVLRRKVMRTVIIGVVRPFVPPAERKLIERKVDRAFKWLRVNWKLFYRTRVRGKKILKGILLLMPLLVLTGGMFVAGAFLGIMATVSLVGGIVMGTLSVLFGPTWAKTIIMPFISRVAAGYGLDRLFPPIWTLIPERIRRRMRSRYMKLWRRTMRPLVRSRKVIGRRGAIVMRRAKQRLREPPKLPATMFWE